MYHFVPLNTVAITVGSLIVATRLPGVINPQRYQQLARQFPRAVWPGIVFLTISLVWCAVIVYYAREDGIALPKHVIYSFMVALYVGLIALKFDYLATRGLSILLLLGAKVIVDSATQPETPWRWVMTVVAYLWAMAGMWFSISPYRLRDLIAWATATESRTRILSAAGCLFGLGCIGLGLFVY